MDVFSSASVFRAYLKIIRLQGEILGVIHNRPILNRFDHFQLQFTLLHRGILAILEVINAPLEEFRVLGLRTSREEWNNPPLTAQDAIEQVDRIVRSMRPLVVNGRNGSLQVPEYDVMFNHSFRFAITRTERLNDGYDDDDEGNMPIVGQGATLEQINRLPLRVVMEEDIEEECTICMEKYKVGEEIRILPCSHRFHKHCIESWLFSNATCPLDRHGISGC